MRGGGGCGYHHVACASVVQLCTWQFGSILHPGLKTGLLRVTDAAIIIIIIIVTIIIIIFIITITKKMLEVSVLLGVGTVLRLEKDAWSMVK